VHERICDEEPSSGSVGVQERKRKLTMYSITLFCASLEAGPERKKGERRTKPANQSPRAAQYANITNEGERRKGKKETEGTRV